jgi:hypothetical protein
VVNQTSFGSPVLPLFLEVFPLSVIRRPGWLDFAITVWYFQRQHCQFVLFHLLLRAKCYSVSAFL